MSPDQSPQIMHPYAFHGVVVTLEVLVRLIVKVDGRIYKHGTSAPVSKTVEIMSYHLTIDSTFYSVAFLK